MDHSPIADPAFPSDPSFAGFPTKLSEDIVAYEVRILNADLSDAALRDRLRSVQTAAVQLRRKLLKDYIWQREDFQLNLVKEQGRSWLAGRTSYGDAIEDEWLIVYLLRELSRQFADVWIRLTDGDGEFLLAEAANVLPKWLNPDVAEHRIWINSGQLLIIPADSPGSGEERRQASKFISLPQALSAIQRSRKDLIHSPIIEEEAFFRLRNYPEQIGNNMHHSLITIPRGLAFIINECPTSIAAAIETFYLRDTITLRPLNAESGSDLRFAPQDFVTARVRFPRVGFAQVRSQRFAPAGIWAQSLNDEQRTMDAKSRDRMDLGAKVTSGYEMLIHDPQSQDRPVVREIKLLLEDLQNGEEKLPSDAEVESWGMTEDDEKWMDIDFRDFEEALDGRRSSSKDATTGKGRNGFGDAAAHENLQKLVSRFEEFLNGDAMADDSNDSDDSDDEDSTTSADGEDKAAGFTEDEFTAMMREMMGMPPETMQELMGERAATASGLGDAEHPDFGEINAHQERLAKLFANLETNSDHTGREHCTPEIVMGNDARKGKEVAQDRSGGKGSEDAEDEEIKHLSALMESELRRSGALDLSDPKKSKERTLRASSEEHETNDAESADEEVMDENYNLVSNLLESFKSQAGVPGPSGTLMGMMGLQMPRDEDSDHEEAPSQRLGAKR